MRSGHGGWVLNMGGKHGTPGIADDNNIVSVRSAGRKTPPGLGAAKKPNLKAEAARLQKQCNRMPNGPHSIKCWNAATLAWGHAFEGNMAKAAAYLKEAKKLVAQKRR